MVKPNFPHHMPVPLALIIDLDALAHNYYIFTSHAKKGTLCGAVLKANAYGMGVKEVGARLYQEGCRHFFMAHLSEGIELKSFVGQDAYIYIMNGLRRGNEEIYAHYDLIPVLGDPLQINIWNNLCQKKQQRLKAVLHFDIGLIRTGLSMRAAQALGILQISHMEIVCVMSHMSCTYQPNHPMNESQRLAFDALRKRFPFALASLANSGGFCLGPEYHYDIIRLGLALTGARTAVPRGDFLLKPVVKAYAQILQINEISKGEAVGYDTTFIAARASRIATLGVGYADGYLRSLSNRGEVYFEEYKLPVVGRVSMDLLTIDITNVPTDKIHIGDWVELFGDHLPLDFLAEKAGTIPWELLTSLGSRYKRFYLSSKEVKEAA